MKLDLQLVVLGTGEKKYHDLFERAAKKYPAKVGGRAHVQQRARAPDRGGERHVPDAVAVRAVRPEPDLQPPVRNDAGRAGDRRSRRHDRGFHPSAGNGTGFKFTRMTAADMLKTIQRAVAVYGDPDGLAEADEERYGKGLLVGGIREEIYPALQEPRAQVNNGRVAVFFDRDGTLIEDRGYHRVPGRVADDSRCGGCRPHAEPPERAGVRHFQPVRCRPRLSSPKPILFPSIIA